jgi:hypothetical protein
VTPLKIENDEDSVSTTFSRMSHFLIKRDLMSLEQSEQSIASCSYINKLLLWRLFVIPVTPNEIENYKDLHCWPIWFAI